MQIELPESIVWHAHGAGVLEFGTDSKGLGVDWQLAQTTSGSLYVMVRPPDSMESGRDILSAALELIPNPKLRGNDESGLYFEVQVREHANAVHASYEHNGWFTLRAKEAEMRREHAEAVAYRFALLNLCLSSPPRARFEVDGIELLIEPVANYADVVSTLYSRDRYAQTAYLTVVTGDHMLASSIADRVCELTSYALGCRVSWLRYDGLNTAGDTVKGNVFCAITGAYTPIPLIGDDSLWLFLQSQWVAYSDFRSSSLKQARMLLGLLTNATSTDDFLELRGLKLGTFVETLARIALPQDPNSLFALKEHSRDFHRRLKTCIHEIADKLLLDDPPGIKAELIEQMQNKTQFIASPSFRTKIAELCTKLAIDVPPEHIRDFVRMRDTLVHQSSFVCDGVGRPKDWRFESSAQEYFWMLRFADRLTLRFLGYRGVFIDRSVRDKLSDVPAEPTTN